MWTSGVEKCATLTPSLISMNYYIGYDTCIGWYWSVWTSFFMDVKLCEDYTAHEQTSLYVLPPPHFWYAKPAFVHGCLFSKRSTLYIYTLWCVLLGDPWSSLDILIIIYKLYSGHTGTCWGVLLGDPRVIRRYYGTIVTLGILVRAGVYIWVTHGSSLDTMELF